MTKPISNFNKPLKTNKPLTNLWIAENFSTYPLLETEENEPAEIDEKTDKRKPVTRNFNFRIIYKKWQRIPQC